jgi:site-specific DNA-adenine methylase
MKSLSVIPYIGGKYRLIPNLVPIVEWCSSYYGLQGYGEPFLGGGRILINVNTARFKFKIANDKDIGICRLFECLRSRNLTYQLIDKLFVLGYNEVIFNHAKKNYFNPDLDIVTAAAYTFITATQSRAANMSSFEHNGLEERTKTYYNKLYRMRSMHVILHDVNIENTDGFEIIERLKNDGSFFLYLDPPYPMESKRNKRNNYKSEKDKPLDHKALADLIVNSKAKVMLSGYANNHNYYDSLEHNGWHKIFIKDLYVSSSGTAGARAKEYIWTNFDIPKSLI